MTDLDKFKSFFKESGVAFTEGENQHVGFSDDRSKGVNFIAVSLTNFHFDASGNFIGVEADDMDRFLPRIK